MANGTADGDAAHTCHLYRSEQSHSDVLVRFLARGLRAGDRCRVLAYTRAPDRAMGALAAEGFILAHEMERGALDVHPSSATPLLEVPFDPQRALDYVRERVDSARSAEFRGLSLALDMRWALASTVRPEALLLFESGLNEIAAELPLRTLCGYAAYEFDGELLRRARVFHGSVLDDPDDEDAPFSPAS